MTVRDGARGAVCGCQLARMPAAMAVAVAQRYSRCGQWMGQHAALWMVGTREHGRMDDTSGLTVRVVGVMGRDAVLRRARAPLARARRELVSAVCASTVRVEGVP